MSNYVERVWTIVGSCRRCGAPILCKTEEMRGHSVPPVYRRCDCLERANQVVKEQGVEADLLGRCN